MAKEEGCRYCRTEENGDIPDDAEDIVDLNIGKILGAPLQVECYINEDKFHVYFTGAGDFFKAKSKKINYCPMCGRELRRWGE